MKKNYLIAAALVIACAWSMKNADLSMSKLAYAVDQTNGNTNFIVSVTNPDDQVFVPSSATYTVTYSLGRTTEPTPSGSVTIADTVDDDSANPSVTATQGDGYILLEHNLPYMKLSGIMGEAYDRSTLGVKQTTSSNDANAIQIGFGNSSTAFAGGNRVDDDSSDVVLWGASDLCTAGNAALIDGSDRDALTDGEIAFGGAAEANGGCNTSVKVDDRNGAVSSVTDGLRFTFTKANS